MRPLTLTLSWALLLVAALLLLAATPCHAATQLYYNRLGRNATFTPRAGHTVTEVDGKLILVGGSSSSVRSNDVLSSTDGVTWTAVSSSSSSRFSPRWGHSALVFRDALWVIAGSTAAGLSNEAWSSADAGATWTLQSNAGFTPRTLASALVWGVTLYVAGGQTDPPATSNIDVWSTLDGITWTELNTASSTSVPSARHSCAWAGMSGELYLLGGITKDDTPAVDDAWSLDVSDELNGVWTSRGSGATADRKGVVGSGTWFNGALTALTMSNNLVSWDGVSFTVTDVSPPMFGLIYPAMVSYNSELLVLGGGTAGDQFYNTVFSSTVWTDTPTTTTGKPCTLPSAWPTGAETDTCTAAGGSIKDKESCKIKAAAGYTLATGSLTLTCTDGTLSSLPTFKLAAGASCKLPTAWPTGSVADTCVLGATLKDKESCNLFTAAGYTLVSGSRTLTCTDGTLSPLPTFQRILVSCKLPSTLPSGALAGTCGAVGASLAHGQSCTLATASGWQQSSGSATLTCNDGTLSALPSYTVIPKDCTLPAFPAGVDKNTCTGTKLADGASCILKPASGYEFAQSGADGKITCTAGTLSALPTFKKGEVVVVIKKDCKLPSTLPQGGALGTCSSALTHAASCRLAAASGWELQSGSTTLTCTDGVLSSMPTFKQTAVEPQPAPSPDAAPSPDPEAAPGPSPAPAPNPEPDSESDSLAGWIIALIVILCLAGVGGVAGALWWMRHKRGKGDDHPGGVGGFTDLSQSKHAAPDLEAQQQMRSAAAAGAIGAPLAAAVAGLKRSDTEKGGYVGLDSEKRTLGDRLLDKKPGSTGGAGEKLAGAVAAGALAGGAYGALAGGGDSDKHANNNDPKPHEFERVQSEPRSSAAATPIATPGATPYSSFSGGNGMTPTVLSTPAAAPSHEDPLRRVVSASDASSGLLSPSYAPPASVVMLDRDAALPVAGSALVAAGTTESMFGSSSKDDSSVRMRGASMSSPASPVAAIVPPKMDRAATMSPRQFHTSPSPRKTQELAAQQPRMYYTQESLVPPPPAVLGASSPQQRSPASLAKDVSPGVGGRDADAVYEYRTMSVPAASASPGGVSPAAPGSATYCSNDDFMPLDGKYMYTLNATGVPGASIPSWNKSIAATAAATLQPGAIGATSFAASGRQKTLQPPSLLDSIDEPAETNGGEEEDAAVDRLRPPQRMREELSRSSRSRSKRSSLGGVEGAAAGAPGAGAEEGLQLEYNYDFAAEDGITYQ